MNLVCVGVPPNVTVKKVGDRKSENRKGDNREGGYEWGSTEKGRIMKVFNPSSHVGMHARGTCTRG